MHTLLSTGRHDYYYYYYHILLYAVMIMMMMETQNGHNSANFEATTFNFEYTFSRFCMATDPINTYRMMMTM